MSQPISRLCVSREGAGAHRDGRSKPLFEAVSFFSPEFLFFDLVKDPPEITDLLFGSLVCA